MEFNNVNNKINSNAISAYKSIKKTKISDSETKSSGKFDSVEIDLSQSIDSAKANIANKLNAESSIDKLRQLQDEYANGNCPISVEEIAKFITG